MSRMSAGSLARILLVEDDPDIQLVASMTLASLGGFEVKVCGSAREALQSGAAFAPDLILLDVMMPGMDGPTALRAFRNLEALAVTPVIFMTAKIQPQELARYRRLGSLGVISKPFDPETLSQRVLDLWRQRLD
jgi:two-component system OmpR family response regulator